MSDDNIELLTIVSVILLVLLIGIFLTSLDSESINTKALDETCQYILNDENAVFYQEWGKQNHFPCLLNGEIILINKMAKKLPTQIIGTFDASENMGRK